MCSVPTLSYVKIYAICDQVFNGPMVPGDGPCTIASDCNAASGALASCNSGGTCENYVIVGKDPGRRAPSELTLFKSLGLAVEDVASAAYLARRARETGTGHTVTM